MISAAEASWPDAAAALHGGVAVLPFGALEQHGPHLPLSTDTLTAEHVAREVARRIDGVLLPAIPYGETWNNAGYPGTVSIAPATVRAIATDIARAVLGAGARALVIVNGDWGNRAPLAEVADRTPGVLVLDYPGYEEAADAVQISPRAAPGLSIRHAEEIETSTTLAIAPELVQREREVAEYPALPPEFGTRPMQLHTLSASGVFGDPRPATADTGRHVLDATIAASVAAVDAFLAGPAAP